MYNFQQEAEHAQQVRERKAQHDEQAHEHALKSFQKHEQKSQEALDFLVSKHQIVSDRAHEYSVDAEGTSSFIGLILRGPCSTP